MKNIFTVLILLCTTLTGCSLNHAVKFYHSQTETKSEWRTESHVATLPFKLVDQKILIPISVNGSQTLNFVLDTGSPATVIIASHKTNDLELKTEGKLFVGGVGDKGNSQASFVHNTDIKVGDLTIVDKSIVYIPLSGLPLFDNLDEIYFDGIIGYNLLSDFIVELDYDTSMMTLYDKETYSKAKYLKEGWVSVQLSVEDYFPYLSSKVKLSENSTPLDLKLLLDTGDSGSLALAPRTHDNITFPTHYYTSTARGLSGDLESYKGFLATAELGNETFTNIVGSFSDGAVIDTNVDNSKHNGSVGNKLFSKFNVVFNYQDSYVLLKRNHRFNIPIKADRSGLGMTVLANKSGYVVKQIVANTSAEKSKLKYGDVITKFNNLPASQENIEKLRHVLSSNNEYVDLCWTSSNEEICDKLALEDRIRTDVN
jgi:predicted aspartyl protease